MEEGKIKRKEIAKNNIIYFLTNEDTVLKDSVKAVLVQLDNIEIAEHAVDAEINSLEKEIKEAKLQPTSEMIESNIQLLK